MIQKPSGREEARRSVILAALALVAFAAGAEALGAQTQPPLAGAASAGPREGTYLYRFAVLQAAPGRLVELIDLLKARAPLIVAGGDEAPYIVRHSQGDHWDLVVILPMKSFADYYRPERIAERDAAAAAAGLPTEAFARRLNALLAWDEDLYVLGPPVEVFRGHVEEAGLLHFEMMQELPGKRDELVEERRMENAFARERGRYETLIFVRETGAAWDVVTLAVYRNWRQYAESELITREAADAAARKAGFENAASVGPYMRTLISTHRDTLGPPVRWEQREP
ncbi:MAG: hypothetical protein JW742_04330 [Candidatus Aminicenantes bacterium]|nr:hypothetical protein [Candidatus Aminicenantes bacterium]